MNKPDTTKNEDILSAIDQLLKTKGLRPLRSAVRSLKEQIFSPPGPARIPDPIDGALGPSGIARDFLLTELDQIEQARTLHRARDHLDRLKRSLVEVNTRSVNDINLNRWKEYGNVLTDSLWLLDRRDGSGGHSAWLWGTLFLRFRSS